MLVYGATQEDHDKNLLAKFKKLALHQTRRNVYLAQQQLSFWVKWSTLTELSLTQTRLKLSMTCLVPPT